jgi:molybdopterin/thiamine biosynthesis adenylyltransferase/rhodanese-related sulfurtransferase
MNGPSFNRGEAERYSRHLILPEIGPEGQSKLKKSSALIVGVGGLGIPAAVQLACAGVGRIGLLDGDTIELSNLQRQFLFSEADVGKKKVEVAGERLRQINPNIRIETHETRLDASNALGFIGAYEIVLDATDSLPTRYLISDACVMLSKPDVYASAQAFDGQLSVFHSPRGPCYRCLYPTPPPPESVKSCEETGVMSVVPAVIGTLQAAQAIGLTVGMGSTLVGRLLIFNALESSFDEVRIKKDDSCAACGAQRSTNHLSGYEGMDTLDRHPLSELDITPSELKAMLEGGAQVTLIDVREPHEYLICRIQGSLLMPIGSLAHKAQQLDRKKLIVTYCHTGNRSVRAVEFLRQSGFTNIRNLKGGIDAWARTVDPTMTRY